MRINTYQVTNFMRFLEIDKKIGVNGVPLGELTNHFMNFIKETKYLEEGNHICKKLLNYADRVNITCADIIDIFKSESKPSYYKFLVYATHPEDKFESIKFFKKTFDIPQDQLDENMKHFVCHKRWYLRSKITEITDLYATIFTSYFLDTLGCFLYSIKGLYHKNPFSIEISTRRDYQRAVECITKMSYDTKKFSMEELVIIAKISRDLTKDKMFEDIYYAKKKIIKRITLSDFDMYREHCNANLTYATKIGGYNNIKFVNNRIKKLLNSYLFYYLELCLPADIYHNVSDSLIQPMIENLDMTPIIIEI